MTDFKRRSANALPLKNGSAATHQRQGSAPSSSPAKASPELHKVKLEAKALQEKLQRSVIDNPQAAKKAAMLISLWIEGKARKTKKAG